MELKDFVRDSILQIVRGMVEAQDVIGEYGASVNPPPLHNPTPDVVRYAATGPDGEKVLSLLQDLEFDVALTSRDTQNDGGKVAVLAGFIGGGISASSEKGQEAISRLRFKVPIGLPIGPGEQPRTKKVTYNVGDWRSSSK